MSQCVPSWDLDDSSAPARPTLHLQTHSNSSKSLAPDVPSLDYEVAELTWENGQLAMHGLGPPRVPNKTPVHFSPPAKYAAAWEKPRAGNGTLESIVNQATYHVPQLTKSASAAENSACVTPWFDHRRAVVNSSGGGGGASMAVTMDALVPCNNRNNDHRETSRHVAGTAAARAGVCSCKTSTPSASESTGTCKERRQLMTTFENRDREYGAGGFASTSMWSADNTSSGKGYTKTTSGEDHDSAACHSRPQRSGDDGEVGNKKGNGKSSSGSTKKRIRAAAIHNQSERKRRDKINQRMKTLQKLVPNSSKTDKASILDEVIEYLKQLQAQVHMMNRMNNNIPFPPQMNMMLPQLAAALQQQQQLQMSSMMGMGMGMQGIMDLNALSRAAAGMPPPMIPPPSGMPSVIQPPPAAAAAAAASAFMSMPSSWDMQPAAADQYRLPSTPAVVMPELLSAFLACQSQPPNMSMDAYTRLAALYHQFQQAPAAAPASDSRNSGLGSKN